MPNKSGSGAAICPFYLSEKPNVIRCEGIVEYTATNICFGYEAEKRYWTKRRCYSYEYNRCPYARALMMLHEKE